MQALLALFMAVLAAYVLWARPYQLRWGASDSEVKGSIPGDELHADPMFLATRAITIDGTPAEIWPWLVQMGYGRPGFHGYVEGRVESMAEQNAEFATYLFLLLIFVVAGLLLLLRPLTWTSWLAAAAAGTAWLVVWYAPIPWWIGLALGLTTCVSLRLSFRA